MTPRKTMKKTKIQTFLKKPTISTANKFDQLNPLYTRNYNQQEEQDPLALTRDKETEKLNKSTKETKRSDKTTRETLMKMTKDNNDAMETKLNEIGHHMDENMPKGLKLVNKGLGSLA